MNPGAFTKAQHNKCNKLRVNRTVLSGERSAFNKEWKCTKKPLVKVDGMLKRLKLLPNCQDLGSVMTIRRRAQEGARYLHLICGLLPAGVVIVQVLCSQTLEGALL